MRVVLVGVMCVLNLNDALKYNVGGELLCYVA